MNNVDVHINIIVVELCMQRVDIRVCLPDTHAAHDLLLARKTSPMSLQTSVYTVSLFIQCSMEGS